MSRRTKGPWVRVGTEVYFPNRAGGFSLHDCPDAEGNAALCAAAPDLLDSLNEMAAPVQSMDLPIKVQLNRAMKALRKARGME